MFCFSQTWQSHLKLPTQTKGKQRFGLAKGQAVAVTLETVAQASAIANNEVSNPAFVNNNKILSASSDSSTYVTGIVNHSVNCILLDTCPTVSNLNVGTWRKSGLKSKLKLVTRTLTTENGNESTVLDKTEVRFCLGSIDCFLSFEIAQKPIPYLDQTFSAL